MPANDTDCCYCCVMPAGRAKARLVKLTLSHDGSCVGAAVLAAAAANGLL